MKLIALVHRLWLTRAGLVLLATVLADSAVGIFAPRPFPWIVLIPATLPLSLLTFVARPVLREEDRESHR